MESSTENLTVCVFFDFRNYLYGLRSVGLDLDIDYRKLVEWLASEVSRRENGAPVKVCDVRMYAATRAWRGTSAFEGGLDRFLSGLERETEFQIFRLPWRDISRECLNCGAMHEVYREGRVDTSIVADMVAMAARGEYRVAVLVSGDSDFIPALDTVRGFGAKVYLASWGRGHGLSYELEEQAAGHFNLALDTRQFATMLTMGDITPEQEGLLLDEIRAAEAHFASRDGYVSEHYFLLHWRGGAHFPESPDRRLAILERLITAGKVERYDRTLADTTTSHAIRLVAPVTIPEKEQPP